MLKFLAFTRCDGPDCGGLRAALQWVAANALVWWLISCLAFANLDVYGDMVENYGWAQAWSWGTFKHPPLFTWVVGLWFAVWPEADWAYYLLSCVNTAVGLTGVALLAHRTLPANRALLAVVLLGMTFPFTTLAYKFNANSILLALWPWTVYCMFRSVRDRSWAATIGLGLLAAASMLGKYYSGVLLLALVATTAATANGRSWWRSRLPWAAGAVFALALAPHLVWLAHHDFATLHYVQEQGNGKIVIGELVKFAAAPLLYSGIGWIAAALMMQTDGWNGLVPRMGRLVMPHRGSEDPWFWICWLPWLVTLLFGATGFVTLSLPWAIPLGYALPLLWLSRSGVVFADDAGPKLARMLVLFWLIALPGAALYQVQQAYKGSSGQYLPRREIAAAVQQRWQQLSPHAPLAWVGGEWPENATLSFYLDAHPRALPGVPDEFPATTMPIADWAQTGGVLFCTGGTPNGCTRMVEDWLIARGLPIRKEVLTVARSGWRFPQTKPFDYTVYWQLPMQPAAQR